MVGVEMMIFTKICIILENWERNDISFNLPEFNHFTTGKEI